MNSIQQLRPSGRGLRSNQKTQAFRPFIIEFSTNKGLKVSIYLVLNYTDQKACPAPSVGGGVAEYLRFIRLIYSNANLKGKTIWHLIGFPMEMPGSNSYFIIRAKSCLSISGKKLLLISADSTLPVSFTTKTRNVLPWIHDSSGYLICEWII